MRNMAYVVTVNSAEPIEGKDRIHYIGFEENGYKVIASKDVKVGDTVVYFEVDSLLPDEPRFEFLKARAWKESENASLIKAMKMCGLRSFGLVMTFEELGIKKAKPGKDLTEELKVRKYEPIEDASPTNKKCKHPFIKFLMKFKLTRNLGRHLLSKTKIKGDFPLHLISKSDEDNILNNKGWFEKYKNEPCYVSMKMEGQSVTAVLEGKNFKVFGRNTIGTEEHFNFFNEMKLEKKMKDLMKREGWKSLAIQGEFCSPKVQKGIYKNGTHFYVYKINVDGSTVDFYNMKTLCERLELETVPIMYELKDGFGTMFKSVEEMQEFVEHQWFRVGKEKIEWVNYIDIPLEPSRKNNELHRAEGMVVCGLNKKDWSFKVKSEEYQIEGI